jgi:hypothetical protein
MTLIPAVMALLGQRAWWLPRWLDRIVPNVDIEGTSLQRPYTDSATSWKGLLRATDQPQPVLLPQLEHV